MKKEKKSSWRFTNTLNKMPLGSIIMLILIILYLLSPFLPTFFIPTENLSNQYVYNWNFSLWNTNLEMTDLNGSVATIKGNPDETVRKTFSFDRYIEPLVMYDDENNIICYSDENFDVLTPNDHQIFKDGLLLYEMKGVNIAPIEKVYLIYDAEDNWIATMKKNATGTKSELRLTDETLIAQSNRNLFGGNYVVSVFENNTLDVDAIQLMFVIVRSER